MATHALQRWPKSGDIADLTFAAITDADTCLGWTKPDPKLGLLIKNPTGGPLSCSIAVQNDRAKNQAQGFLDAQPFALTIAAGTTVMVKPDWYSYASGAADMTFGTGNVGLQVANVNCPFDAYTYGTAAAAPWTRQL